MSIYPDTEQTRISKLGVCHLGLKRKKEIGFTVKTAMQKASAASVNMMQN